MNTGTHPLRVVVFVQRSVGFEHGPIHVRAGKKDLRVEVADVVTRIGGPDRPVWVAGIVPAHGEAGLDEWRVADPVAVGSVLAADRVQVGILAMAARGSIAAEARGVAPPGADGPEDGAFLFPHQVFHTGTHVLPSRCFSTPDPGLAACASPAAPVDPGSPSNPDSEGER